MKIQAQLISGRQLESSVRAIFSLLIRQVSHCPCQNFNELLWFYMHRSYDMKGAELCMAKCETDRLRSLKTFMDNLFKIKISDTASQVSHLDETISLLSEQSVKKGASRLASFFRNRGKKSVSFDESTSVILPNSTPAGDQADTVSISTIDKNMNALLEEDWFHGVLPREDVVRLLRT